MRRYVFPGKGIFEKLNAGQNQAAPAHKMVVMIHIAVHK